MGMIAQEVEKVIREAGEHLVYEVGVTGLPKEIIEILGRFKFRTSYGQSMIEHTKEVVNLGKILAEEVGADVNIVKTACLLHDIGKTVSAEVEGPHAELGAQIARRYGLPEKVVAAFESHHEDNLTSLEAVIVYIADAISAARPGARYEGLETYIKRVTEMENIAQSFGGVDKSFAISAGREVRVIVLPEKISDDEMVKLAHDVSVKIHEQVTYPGQVKVTVIRETRVTDIAK